MNIIKKIIRSAAVKYIAIVMLLSVAITDLANIGVCLINYAVTVNKNYLNGIMVLALIVSVCITLSIYIIKKNK